MDDKVKFLNVKKFEKELKEKTFTPVTNSIQEKFQEFRFLKKKINPKDLLWCFKLKIRFFYI